MLQTKIFPLTLLIILITLVYWLYQFTNFDSISDEFETNAPNLTVFNVVNIWFDSKGKPVNKLIASTLYHYQQDDIIWAYSNLFEHIQDGKPKLTISSVRAKFTRDANVGFMYGKTQLIRKETEDQAAWVTDTSDVSINLTNKTAQSSSPTVVKIKTNSIRAGGFYADYKNNLLKFYKGVQVEYVPAK